MNINTAFPSDYLKAADIPAGRRVGVTIESVTVEKLGDDTRPVVYFVGKDKGLVLNKTNANMIIEIAKSEETDNWTGVRIALYSTKVDFQGRRVDALRVDYPATNNGQAQARQPMRPAAQQPPPLVDGGELSEVPSFDGDEIPF